MPRLGCPTKHAEDVLVCVEQQFVAPQQAGPGVDGSDMSMQGR